MLELYITHMCNIKYNTRAHTNREAITTTFIITIIPNSIYGCFCIMLKNNRRTLFPFATWFSFKRLRLFAIRAMLPRCGHSFSTTIIVLVPISHRIASRSFTISFVSVGVYGVVWPPAICVCTYSFSTQPPYRSVVYTDIQYSYMCYLRVRMCVYSTVM